jgi:hypothetical protein
LLEEAKRVSGKLTDLESSQSERIVTEEKTYEELLEEAGNCENLFSQFKNKKPLLRNSIIDDRD